MSIATIATKLVVGDLAATERFYRALGLQVVSRNLGGEDEVRQEQCWLSATGDASAHILILSRFVELPPPPAPTYPGEVWLAFNVPDVDAACAAVTAAGGGVHRPGEDRPEHGVRAAVVTDPEGHFIELVGPMAGR
ncbi:VOC family protein [Phenylobacterium sp. LjRoot219]|uniref:VOC family protein n=1 Tax=Phenylobacterium sp. LjRoot219 TaxID=3342283 RepID=UPI003ECD697F